MQPKAANVIKIIFTLAFFVTLYGCTTPGRVIMEDDQGIVIIESKGEEGHYPNSSGRQGRYYPSEEYKIPPGHMPPPGECRIWYPDLPPGKQPPPGDCDYLRYRVHPGAWLVEG